MNIEKLFNNQSPESKQDKEKVQERNTFWNKNHKQIQILIERDDVVAAEKAKIISNLRLDYLHNLTQRKPGERYLFHDTPIYNLSAILKEGIITAEFAKRIKKDNKQYQQQWGISPTKRICLFPDSSTLGTITCSKNQLATLIVDPEIDYEYCGDRLVRNRIAPREILAVTFSPDILEYAENQELLGINLGNANNEEQLRTKIMTNIQNNKQPVIFNEYLIYPEKSIPFLIHKRNYETLEKVGKNPNVISFKAIRSRFDFKFVINPEYKNF